MNKHAVLASLFAIAAAFALPVQAAQDAPTLHLQQVDRPSVITKHTGRFNGIKVDYTATVEPTVVVASDGLTRARLISFAYTRDGTTPNERPVLFLFNGGPIVPSMYLHLGGLGPKRVAYPDDVRANPDTFKLVDNADSPLDAVDLVFVDPASTGFSRAMPGTSPNAYFSIDADAAQIAGFIRTWLLQNGRPNSPVYILGESYGTNRAAVVAGQLAEGPDPLKLSGIYLFGQAVNIIEYSQRPTNIMSYVASLPTLAATGWYHDRVERKGRTFTQFMEEARAFAKTDYLMALYRGSDLPVTDQEVIAARLQEFSGISAKWYLANGLKITKEQYRLDLLKDQSLLLGRSDARYVAPVTKEGNRPDPSDIVGDAVEHFFGSYLRNDLKVTWSDPYLTKPPVSGLSEWNWGRAVSPFQDWPYHLGISKMLELNPNLKIFVANGIYDTQTTMGAAELLVTQAGWKPSNVTLRYYDGGHMGYSVAATAREMGDDIREWVRR